jgi:anti-sigma factor RsiW
MSSFAHQHPEDGVLLRFIDGELPARKARAVRRHLEACWQCRTAIEELQGTVADCVRYRRNVLAAHLPEPPNSWPDLYREFDRIDLAEASRSRTTRLFGWLAAPPVRRWAAAAAVAMLAAVVVFQFRLTPSVQAAALLKRAASAAEARAPKPRRIEIRTSSRRITRTLGARGIAAASADPAEAALAARFQAAHYDWDDPLSARAFLDWRSGLASARDDVATLADSYRIRTRPSEGDLESASLTLRETDLEPIAARFEFRDREWVEFTGLADASTPGGVPPAVSSVEPPVRRAEPSRPAAPVPEASALVSEELQVIAALDGIGADLGDPLDISVSDGKVRVTGVGIPPARREQISAALNRLPGVVLEFSEPAAPAPAAQVPETAAGNTVPAVRPRIEKQLGGHAEFERVSSFLLDRNEALMARAYALRALARRFPAAEESALGPKDRQVLRGLASGHAIALGRELASIERVLEPVLVSMGGSGATRSPAAGSAWQPAAEDVFASAHQVELLLSATLGVSSDAGPAERLPSDLLSAMAALRAQLDQIQKFAGQ